MCATPYERVDGKVRKLMEMGLLETHGTMMNIASNHRRRESNKEAKHKLNKYSCIVLSLSNVIAVFYSMKREKQLVLLGCLFEATRATTQK